MAGKVPSNVYDNIFPCLSFAPFEQYGRDILYRELFRAYTRIHGHWLDNDTLRIWWGHDVSFFHSGINVGASGACYGLFGAIYADLWTNWDLVVADYEHNPVDMDFLAKNATNIVTLWLGIRYCLMVEFCLFAVYFPLKKYTGIAHSGHFGGLFFGFCLALPLLKYSRGYDHLISNDSLRTHRGWFPLLRRVVFFAGLVLFLGMGFRIWSFDGSPPVLCPCCFNRHSFDCKAVTPICTGNNSVSLRGI